MNVEIYDLDEFVAEIRKDANLIEDRILRAVIHTYDRYTDVRIGAIIRDKLVEFYEYYDTKDPQSPGPSEKKRALAEDQLEKVNDTIKALTKELKLDVRVGRFKPSIVIDRD